MGELQKRKFYCLEDLHTDEPWAKNLGCPEVVTVKDIEEAKKEIYKEFSILDTMHKPTLEHYKEMAKKGIAGPSVKQVLVLLKWLGEKEETKKDG